MPLFTPPLTEGIPIADASKRLTDGAHALWSFYDTWAMGKTVWKDQLGAWHESIYPYQGGQIDRIFRNGVLISEVTDTSVQSLANAVRVYEGGHVHPITEAEAAELVAAGFGSGVDPNHALLNSSTGFASTPDHADFAITDIDATVKVALDDWTPSTVSNLISQSDIIANIGWSLAIRQDGHMGVAWSTDGGTGGHHDHHTSFPLGFQPGETHTLRTTLDVDDGAGRHVVTFYVDGSQIEKAAFTGTTSINNSTTVVRVGNPVLPVVGRIYSATLKSSIDGAAITDPNFQTQPIGTTSFTDSTGKTWTVNSPATIG